MPICCVELLFRDGSDILLVKRKQHPAKDQWWFPGGRIHKNETVQDAAIRKAKEELNLDVYFEKVVKVYEVMFKQGPFDLKTGIHSINILVEVKPQTTPILHKHIKLDQNHSDWVFMNDNCIDKMLKIKGVVYKHLI
ncbi:MAG: NUDIX domain-containing protein [Candidatus Nanoarchaeia archaeon]